MDIKEGITRVRAAKTSGDCRKAIADASHSLGVAANIRETFDNAKLALEASDKMSPEIVADLLGSISLNIKAQEIEANRNLDSVLNAVIKTFENIKDISDKSEKLKLTRGVFELVEKLIPQTAN